MALTDSPTYSMHDVCVTLSPSETVTRAMLEELALRVEDVLYRHACGEHFSAAVACSFDPPQIEIDLSIPAVSGSLANRRVSEILEKLEKHLSSLDLDEQRLQRGTPHHGALAAST